MVRRTGFTLIELLIVVAIIGILAAIAVPNFMNARTKATIARVVSDLKAVTQAMDMYRLDRNSYINENESYCPPKGNPSVECGLAWLTQLGYMGSIPVDPFENKAVTASGTTGIDMYEVAVAPSQPNPIKKFFNISSRGPDQDEDMGSRTDLMLGASIATYHPSNGVNSNGDIYIFGGDASVLQGPLIIDGKTYMHNYPGNSWF